MEKDLLSHRVMSRWQDIKISTIYASNLYNVALISINIQWNLKLSFAVDFPKEVLRDINKNVSTTMMVPASVKGANLHVRLSGEFLQSHTFSRMLQIPSLLPHHHPHHPHLHHQCWHLPILPSEEQRHLNSEHHFNSAGHFHSSEVSPTKPFQKSLFLDYPWFFDYC